MRCCQCHRVSVASPQSAGFRIRLTHLPFALYVHLVLQIWPDVSNFVRGGIYLRYEVTVARDHVKLLINTQNSTQELVFAIIAMLPCLERPVTEENRFLRRGNYCTNKYIGTSLSA